ncbi:MAG TPA: SLOG family protein [Nitrososphaeraceae archaeon]|nr:SLOG family protein [Nitrososphaeraceae archaeon]
MINKVAVIGSRNFNAYVYFCEKLELIISKLEGEIEFVSGGCSSGGDALISRYCKENGLKLTEHLADWTNLGKRAGFVRNKLIVDDCTHLIAFWDGISRGLNHL